jgi:hypothetical protein
MGVNSLMLRPGRNASLGHWLNSRLKTLNTSSFVGGFFVMESFFSHATMAKCSVLGLYPVRNSAARHRAAGSGMCDGLKLWKAPLSCGMMVELICSWSKSSPYRFFVSLSGWIILPIIAKVILFESRFKIRNAREKDPCKN